MFDPALSSGPPAWSPELYEEALSTLLPLLRQHLSAAVAGEGPVSPYQPLPEVIDALNVRPAVEGDGWRLEDFKTFVHAYLEHATRLHHPQSLAHQVAVPDVPAALGDLIHGVLNNPMGIYEMGPSAVAAEHLVISWMLKKIGWTPEPDKGGLRHNQGGGVLTHGGSLGNLTALLAARGTVDPDAWEQGADPTLAVLAPANSHYSLARAVSIMGLGHRALVPLPVDSREVVKPAGVEAALVRLSKEGRRCLAVVINACATSTGLHDPIAAVADICAAHGVWLHVDACHGAAALLSQTHRARLTGIERADSVVWDAHKMLRTSGLCAAVLFRTARSFDAAFNQEASYLLYGDPETPNRLVRTVECTKTGMGLKVLLNLAWRGERGLGDYVEHTYALAQTFANQVRRRPNFECPFAPETNIVCFRYGTDNARQVAIREHLLHAGQWHLSSTEVHGVRYLRVTLMNPSTTPEHLERLLDAIVDANRALE